MTHLGVNLILAIKEHVLPGTKVKVALPPHVIEKLKASGALKEVVASKQQQQQQPCLQQQQAQAAAALALTPPAVPASAAAAITSKRVVAIQAPQPFDSIDIADIR